MSLRMRINQGSNQSHAGNSVCATTGAARRTQTSSPIFRTGTDRSPCALHVMGRILTIPDRVSEQRYECFAECSLWCVTLGASSGLNALVFLHLLLLLLIRRLFQAVTLNGLWAFFNAAVAFSLSHVVDYPRLKTAVILHAMVRVLSICLFQTVSLSFVISVFVWLSLRSVIQLRTSLFCVIVWPVLSHCVFPTVFLKLGRGAFLSKRVFDMLPLVYHLISNGSALHHSVWRLLSRCLFRIVFLNLVRSCDSLRSVTFGVFL